MQVGNWRYLSLREARLTFLFWFKEVGYSLGIYWIAFATLLSIIFPSPPLSKPRRLELRIRGEEREGREGGEGGSPVILPSLFRWGEEWGGPQLSAPVRTGDHRHCLAWRHRRHTINFWAGGRGAPTLGWSSSFSSLSHLSSSLSLAIYFTDPLAEIL